MTQPGSPRSLPPRRRPPTFQPRFMVGMLYLVGFFLLYSLMQVMPELLRVLETVEGDAAREKAAYEAAQAHARPLWCFLAAVATVVVGAHFRVLPGLRQG